MYRFIATYHIDPLPTRSSSYTTGASHVAGCNSWIAIDAAVPHVIECGGVSDDDLAATEPMVRPVYIACGCASGLGHTHHHRYDENLHDASPSVKNHNAFLHSS
jgi:hypothetical protein